MFNLRIVAPDGHTMSSTEIRDYLQNDAGNELVKRLDAAAGGFRCPVHDKEPTFTIALTSELKCEISVTTCCDTAQAEAARAIQSIL